MSLEAMIRQVLERNGQESGLSTVVALHTAQMREWGVRGGHLEFRPVQDDLKSNRFKFIARQHQRNRLSSRLNYVMDCFVCRGEIAWLFLPDPSSAGDYIIDFFVGGLNHPDPEFKVFYKPGGREIEKVVFIYSYDQDTPIPTGSSKRWVTIVVTEDWIEQSESTTKISFNQISGSLQYSGVKSNTYGSFGNLNSNNRYPNPFAPNLPVKISKNNARRSGQQGSDDFFWIRSLIEDHEELLSKAHHNLKRFSNPSLVTTRSAQEVLESNRGSIPQTWASANRYVDNIGDMYSGSTHPMDTPSFGMSRTPNGFLAGGATSTDSGNIADIIGGVGDGERFGYIQADPVSGDQNLWIRQIRELIHWSLGGVDPLGLSASATFGEIRTLFGRVQNSADLKAQSLYGEGLCEVYEQILANEEKRFKEWLFYALKNGQYAQNFVNLTSPDQLTDEKCQQLADLAKQGVIQLPQPVGLLPYGDRSVTWRYTREVFQLTTREELDRSIAARNEREDGLSQEWVLRKQYPDMTDQEIRNAMSGFSPRVVASAQGAIQGLMQMYSQFMQIPDPSPEVRKNLPKDAPPPPWGLRLGLPQLVEQAMLTLQKEISYSKPIYEEADNTVVKDSKVTLDQIASFSPITNIGEINNNGTTSPNIPTESGQSSLSTYGLPTSVLPLLERAINARSDRPDQQSSASSGLFTGKGFSYPSPGATVSNFSTTAGEPVWDTRSGEYGSIYAAQPSGFKPSIPGNGIDPSIWNLYRDQLAALAASLATSAGAT